MADTSFKTNPIHLHELLKNCHSGVLQLPDFQRSWVWDEARIKSLVASVSRAFPVGALMTLDTGGEVHFQPRPVEGAPDDAARTKPSSWLLDGQQRMTSLYQVMLRNDVVATFTAKKKKIERWFYIDILKALDPNADREDAIVSVPEDRKIKADFNRKIELDLSTAELEFENLMFPLNRAFDWNQWQMQFVSYSNSKGSFAEKWPIINQFHDEVIANFTSYQVPVIALGRDTPKEAVCTIFEKVNTGGKPLDAFELVTAMFAAKGHELRKDWYGDGTKSGRQMRLAAILAPAGKRAGILQNVASTDFLQVISLFHTRERRRAAEEAGAKDLPQVTGKREALLKLDFEAYKKYESQVEAGFERAAKFLFSLNIFRAEDLPYQSQIIPLAAILAEIGDVADHVAIKEKLILWFWNGVFGELYGSTTDTRFTKDFLEVPPWLKGGPIPSTVSEAAFRPDRLKTMRMRISAAYKGIHVLLMNVGARDFRSGQKFDHTVFFGEYVDIHHVFPQDWCKKAGIDPKVSDSIINKTPLAFKTNRMIGGTAPSIYLQKLEAGKDSPQYIERSKLDEFLRSHLISPELLRSDDFYGFMEDRQSQLLLLIEKAMGKSADAGPIRDEERKEEGETEESDFALAAA